MKATNDRPAFPVAGSNSHHGMSLRDYFAGQALVGIVAHRGPSVDKWGAAGDAARAYEVADAMLKARAS